MLVDSQANSSGTGTTSFIVNLRSGGGRAQKMWPKVEPTLPRYVGDSCAVRYTEGPSHATELAREEIRRGAKTVIAVGGDGTLNEVVNGFFENGSLVNPEAALGTICFGTGADFIRTIEWPKDAHDALRRIAQRNVRRVDIGRAEFQDMQDRNALRYFINIADFGMGGAVVDRVNRSSKRLGGTVSFLWGILVTFLSYGGQTVSYRLDGKECGPEKIQNFIIGNGRYFGSGIKSAPLAELDDGKLDVVVIHRSSLLSMLMDFPAFQRGEHLGMKNTFFQQAQSIEAKSEEKVLIDMDGELIGRLPISVKLLPGILPLCV